MKLHPLTIDALRHKADVAGDSFDPTDPETEWAKVAETECRAVADAGTVAELAARKTAADELENYLLADMPPSERRAIQADLCRAGFGDVFNPEAVCTRRPKLQIVDGVRYIVG